MLSLLQRKGIIRLCLICWMTLCVHLTLPKSSILLADLIWTQKGCFFLQQTANSLTESHISKTYYCELEHPETPEHQQEITRAFEEGITVGPEDNEEGFTCQPAFLKWKDDSSALLTIYEGKYHQVKRMFAAVGNKIIFLKRTSIGQ